MIDNYLTADPALPSITGAYGAHTNYVAVLKGLNFDTLYQYKVTGPGMPSGGFVSSFRTRKTSATFSFIVEGDEGYFPTVPNSTPARVIDYEARIAHLIYNNASISVPNEPLRPAPDFILNTGVYLACGYQRFPRFDHRRYQHRRQGADRPYEQLLL